MATMNPFDLLSDDTQDPSYRIEAEQQKSAAPPAAAAAAKKPQLNKQAQLPTKPTPPSQAVREARNETSRGGRGGGGRGRGYGRGRGAGGFNRDYFGDENSFAAPAGHGPPEGDTWKPSERLGYGGSRGPYRGGRRRGGGFSNGEGGEDGHPGRAFERHSGTGRGSEFKREGSGRGNWGNQTEEHAPAAEEANETGKNLIDDKPSGEEDVAADGNKEKPSNEAAEKEAEDKEMTLEEYEKVLEEKRKALQALKTEERKVDTKVFESMQQLSSKKDNDDIFIKLGSDKDKRKEALEKEEKSKKSVSINEFLKPAEGETYHNQGRSRGRGRGRGRGATGGFGGGYAAVYENERAPAIGDHGQFPTLSAK
ncbi:RGG repeats nuclear RNA binding protein A-like [Arachis stenosperma]|uniref:RGG repeats nuclear RNA binding protein A-like n=1 Tax=Arachis stenosperma TaxID=217475 RepID=UPI0025AB7765|nr:RGG repeats nuclear RNA binding protein A-like [Arachis stenosperma]